MKNRYFNRLAVNRLQALSLKAESTKEKPSYLFSLDIKEGKFDNNTLTFNNNNNYELITFTDRPFRYSSGETDGNKAEKQLNDLFNLDNSENSFSNDPPNAVLITSDGQEAFEVLKLTTNNKIIYMELKPLRGDLPSNTGKMYLFIDGNMKPTNVDNILIIEQMSIKDYKSFNARGRHVRIQNVDISDHTVGGKPISNGSLTVTNAKSYTLKNVTIKMPSEFRNTPNYIAIWNGDINSEELNISWNVSFDPWKNQTLNLNISDTSF